VAERRNAALDVKRRARDDADAGICVVATSAVVIVLVPPTFSKAPAPLTPPGSAPFAVAPLMSMGFATVMLPGKLDGRADRRSRATADGDGADAKALSLANCRTPAFTVTGPVKRLLLPLRVNVPTSVFVKPRFVGPKLPVRFSVVL